MKNSLARRFCDIASTERAIEIACKNEVNRVEAAHLFALLNGESASALNGVRGGDGRKYYNIVYNLLGSDRDRLYSTESVFAAYNKKYREKISVEDIRNLQFALLLDENNDEPDFLKEPKPAAVDDVASEEYNELLNKYKKLKNEYLDVCSLLRTTKAELNVVKIEKQVLEETKEKMIEAFKLQP